MAAQIQARSHPATGAKAVAYLRRSTDRQEQSLDDQWHTIETYAAEEGFEIIKWFVDNAISGTSTQARKAFQAMVQAAQAPESIFRHVLVYDVKRFGRVDTDEGGYYRHLLRRAQVEVIYVSEGFNGDDSDDLIRSVKQWQARNESKDLSKVTIRGQVSHTENGFWGGDKHRQLGMTSSTPMPTASPIRSSAGWPTATRRSTTECLEHRLQTAGNRQLMTSELIGTLCDHAAGNYRVMTNMAAELLAAAVQRECTQLDEKLYLEVFAAPRAAAKPRRATVTRRR